MTLHSTMAVFAPVDVEALFAFCQRLVSTPAQHMGENTWADRNDRDPDNKACMGNVPGLGAESLMWIDYGKGEDGANVAMTHDCSNDEYCKKDYGDGRPFHEYLLERPDTFAHVTVNFDTPYGYRGPLGSCSRQHALFMAAVGEWLDRQGVTDWKWENEYTGEWSDRFEGLIAFGDEHTKPGGADDWFRSVVVPALELEGFTFD